jgi:hypothetical protein
MVRGANGVQSDKSEDEDLEPYYRLIEMQKQMIDLIQQNAHTERECATLRAQLAQELAAVTRSRRRLPERLRDSASELFKRLLRRNGHEPRDMRSPFTIGWSQSFEQRNGSRTSQRATINS